jgi:adenylylsulfate kinase-like enzyme
VIPVLWVCGPPGVGKTATTWAAFECLRRERANVAFVDVDQLGMCYPERDDDPGRHRLELDNVAAVRDGFSEEGAEVLLVAGVVDGSGAVDPRSIGGAVTIVRLTADEPILRARLAQRHGSFVEPAAAVREAKLLDRSGIGDVVIDTSASTATDVAAQLLAVDVGRACRGPDEPAPGDLAGGGVVWLFGPPGVGASTIGFQLFMGLVGDGHTTAYLDARQLGFLGRGDDVEVRARNIAAVWRRFQREGATRLVVSGPVIDVAPYERALAGSSVTWCRLQADGAELARRLATRQAGGSWPEPGDPLRGATAEQLASAIARAEADARRLEASGLGHRLDVTHLEPAGAAAAVRHLARW